MSFSADDELSRLLTSHKFPRLRREKQRRWLTSKWTITNADERTKQTLHKTCTKSDSERCKTCIMRQQGAETSKARSSLVFFCGAIAPACRTCGLWLSEDLRLARFLREKRKEESCYEPLSSSFVSIDWCSLLRFTSTPAPRAGRLRLSRDQPGQRPPMETCRSTDIPCCRDKMSLTSSQPP